LFSLSATRSLLFVIIALGLLTGPLAFGQAPAPKPKSGEPKPKPGEPQRLSFAEAQRLLEGEAEGNLSKRPNIFSATRLRAGQVLELYYPVTGTKRGARPARVTVAGYGLLYASEADYADSKRPRHILEDLIPDPQAFIDAVPQLIARLQKRLRVSAPSLDYSPASLRRIDQYVAAYQRTHTTAETDPQLFQEITAYYGEALRRALNGVWRVRQERMDRTRAQGEPNIIFEVGHPPATGERKPWSSVVNALHDEDLRGLKLATAFTADLAAAKASANAFQRNR
jgi:hypothetical protein